MPKKGTQHRVFPYRLNAMSALENTPEFSYATHAIGVNVRKLGILWATIEYQAWFHQTRLAIDMNYFLIFYSGKRLAERFKLPLLRISRRYSRVPNAKWHRVGNRILIGFQRQCLPKPYVRGDEFILTAIPCIDNLRKLLALSHFQTIGRD